MAKMAPGGENKSSKKGMAKESGHPSSVKGIEGEHDHAGEKGGKGVVFRLPADEDCTDHSRVRDLD
jgi:hypothetical protein